MLVAEANPYSDPIKKVSKSSFGILLQVSEKKVLLLYRFWKK